MASVRAEGLDRPDSISGRFADFFFLSAVIRLVLDSIAHTAQWLGCTLWDLKFSGRTPKPLTTVLYHKLRQVMLCNGNIEAPSRNQCCREKAISITCFDCLSVVLVVQHPKRMRRIILSSVACPALSNFFTLSHKRHDL